MEIILRTVGVYLGLLLLFRLMGRRSMSTLSAFDYILFLIISEAIQNALVDDDKSVVMGMMVIMTFLMLELGLSALKARYKFIEHLAEGAPVILIDRGQIREEHMAKSRITLGDILQMARESQGLERLDDIKYAILESSGNISIVPWGPKLEERIARIEAATDAILKKLGDGPNRESPL